MEHVRTPRPGDIYRHYKDKLYQIITVAIHTESNEPMVVYQAMYGDFRTYVRPLTSFTSTLDPKEYPQAGQKHRFELVRSAEVDLNELTVQKDSSLPISEVKVKLTADDERVKTAEEKAEAKSAAGEATIEAAAEDEKIKATAEKAEKKIYQVKEVDGQKLSGEGVNIVLMKFLEADSYYDKLDIVSSNRKHLNDRLINDMAVAIDCTVEDGPLDERIEGLISCLQAMCRFEQKRSHTAHTRFIK